MTNRLQQMEEVQKQVLKRYGPVPTTGSVDHVHIVGHQLRRQLDAEIRHVTLSRMGLADALTKVFVESACVLRGRSLELPTGLRKKMPTSMSGVCNVLREDVFAPKNALYDNTFGDCGAVGVVIRLLDQILKIKSHDGLESVETTIAHVANYSIMALMLLVESDNKFLS